MIQKGSRVRITDELLWKFETGRARGEARPGIVKRTEIVDGLPHHWIRWDGTEGYGPQMRYPETDLVEWTEER